jgi:perosamine synthetase
MPNINAALGCAQLEQLPDRLARKRTLAARYAAAFEGFGPAVIQAAPPRSTPNFWLNTLVLHAEFTGLRDALLERLHGAGLMCRPVWSPLHRLPHLADAPRQQLPVTEDLAARIISLPSSASLAGPPD